MVGSARTRRLRWLETPITFDRQEFLDNIPSLGRFLLIVSPIIECAHLTKVLMDGGSV